MYRHILELLKEFPLYPKIIVTQYDEIAGSASEYGFEAILNHYPELGISHSIQLGLDAALKSVPSLEGVMFGVCDQPYLKRTSIERLVNAFYRTDKNIAALSFQESIGNPCIFGNKYYGELLALTLDVGGKRIIKRHPEDVELIMVQEEKELIDIDTKDKNCL
jgi:molybdenum cofactor cytidylyltransferase